jgi:hypothetical protein
MWLSSAGFRAVDCYWLRAGFAIFGGYKSIEAPPVDDASMHSALESASRALAAAAET